MVHYYDEAKPEHERTPDEYRLDDSLPMPAQWWSPGGKLAQDGGSVSRETLRAALDGETADGQKLVQAAKRNTRVAAWDMAWSAPKSVSATWAVADPETQRGIQADMVASVRDGMASLYAAGAMETRRGHNGVSRETVADAQAALFSHATSRAGDPQLHVHAVFANVSIRYDGTSGTVLSRPIYEAKAWAGGIMLEALAQRMEARGLAVERLDTSQKADAGFRIVGVPLELEKLWSKRSATIHAKAAETPGMAANGPRRQNQLAKITRATRRLKSSLPSFGNLQQRWKDELRAIGMTMQGVWDRIKEAATRIKDRFMPQEKQTIKEPDATERLVRVYARKVSAGEMPFSAAVDRTMALTAPKPIGVNPVHKTPIYAADTPGPVRQRSIATERVLAAIEKVDRGTAWDDVLKAGRDAAPAKGRTMERER